MTDPPPAKKARSVDKNTNGLLTSDEIRTTKIQFQKDTPFPRFDDLLHEYCRFLEIRVSDPTKPFAPSVLIDKLWHARILSTRAYLAFCQRHNHGQYLHHDPTVKQGQERYDLTLQVYEKLYGEKRSDKEIWPDRVDEIPKQEENESSGAVKEESEDRAHVKQQGHDTSNQNDQDEGNESSEYEDSDVEAEREYLEDYGDERGTTAEALAEWHKRAIMKPKYNEGCDPYKHCQCFDGHKWVEGEFDLSCEGCRESSRGLGSFTCG